MKYYLCTTNNFDFLIDAEQERKLQKYTEPGCQKSFELEGCTIVPKSIADIVTEDKMKQRDIYRGVNRCYDCGRIMEQREICDCILNKELEAEESNKKLIERWNQFKDTRTGFNKAYHQVRNTNTKTGLLPEAELTPYTTKLIAKIMSNNDMRKVNGTIKNYAEEVINRFPNDTYSLHRYTYIQFWEKEVYLNYMSR